MSRIALCDTSGPLTDLLQKMSGENGAAWLEKLNSMLREKAEEPSLLDFAFMAEVAEIGGKKTKDCFSDESRYYYRDTNLDLWLPEIQPTEPKGKLIVHELNKSATLKQIIENFLRESGDVEILSRGLRSLNIAVTLPRIESLIDRQESGEDVGLLTKGYANFFFVEDKKDGVSVVRVCRPGGPWHVGVHRLGGVYVWFGGGRFFFRN